MPDFEVFSVSSEADPDDGCLILVLEGEMDGTPGSCQFKMEGIRADTIQTLGRDSAAKQDQGTPGGESLAQRQQHEMDD